MAFRLRHSSFLLRALLVALLLGGQVMAADHVLGHADSNTLEHCEACPVAAQLDHAGVETSASLVAPSICVSFISQTDSQPRQAVDIIPQPRAPPTVTPSTC